jgi:hypothetical protein
MARPGFSHLNIFGLRPSQNVVAAICSKGEGNNELMEYWSIAEYQIQSTRSRGFRCQVSGKKNNKTETCTLNTETSICPEH